MSKIFDKLTREYVKNTQDFLQENSTYFTRMPNGFRVGYIETEDAISISLFQDKKLEPRSE